MKPNGHLQLLSQKSDPFGSYSPHDRPRRCSMRHYDRHGLRRLRVAATAAGHPRPTPALQRIYRHIKNIP